MRVVSGMTHKHPVHCYRVRARRDDLPRWGGRAVRMWSKDQHSMLRAHCGLSFPFSYFFLIWPNGYYLFFPFISLYLNHIFPLRKNVYPFFLLLLRHPGLHSHLTKTTRTISPSTVLRVLWPLPVPRRDHSDGTATLVGVTPSLPTLCSVSFRLQELLFS